jgi:hypothetical protein
MDIPKAVGTYTMPTMLIFITQQKRLGFAPFFYFYQDSKFPIKLITTKSDSRRSDNSAAEYARAGRLTDGGECAGNCDGAVFKFRAAYKLIKTDA